MERRRLLFEYNPPRAHPILYAGLIVFGFVFVTGSIENALRDDRALLYAAYALPLVFTAFVMAALFPNPIRIHETGIEPSRPLILRWWRSFIAWDDLAAVYPSYYDVTGAFVSPFASSDGKVTQMGLGLEWPDGRTETVRFTPTRFSLTSRKSRGFREALAVVQEIMRSRGRPMVPSSPIFTDEERTAMLAEARAPFLPFFAIVFLFASAAPVTLVLIRLGVPELWALLLGLIAPVATSLRSFTKSRDRNRILNALSKATEHERSTQGGGPDVSPPGAQPARAMAAPSEPIAYSAPAGSP